MGWAVLLPGLAALFVFNKKVNPKRRGQNLVAILTVAIAVIAGCGLALTFGGQWVAGIVGWIGSMLASLTGVGHWMEVGVSIAVTGLMVLWVWADVSFDKTADKGAQFAALVMPTLVFLVAGGLMGQKGGAAVETVTSQVASFMVQLGGN